MSETGALRHRRGNGSIVARGHSGERRVAKAARSTTDARSERLDAGELGNLLRRLADNVSERRGATAELLPVALDIEVDGLRCLVLVESPGRTDATLSPREEEIARMVGLGYPNKTIAANLGISCWTVSTHLRRMFAKFGVRSRAALIAAVLEERRSSDERRALEH